MNPLLKNRKTIIGYSSAMMGFAVIYSVVTGLPAGMHWDCLLVGAVVYGVVFGMAGIMLWSVLRYAIPRDGLTAVKVFVTAAAGILITGLTMGAEVLAIYLYDPGCMSSYTAVLPQRILISALFFVLLSVIFDASVVREIAEDAPLSEQPEVEAIERISVRNGSKVKIILIGDIECIKAEGDYVGIVTCDGRWLKEQTMKYFEENLPAAKFIRVHRSYIVNADKISRLERYDNVYRITLHSGENLKVSQNGYKLLKQRLDM